MDPVEQVSKDSLNPDNVYALDSENCLFVWIGSGQSCLHLLYIIHYTLYIIQYTLYIIHYTLYNIHYILYIIHIIHYTLYIIHSL